MGPLLNIAKEQVYEMLAQSWFAKKACDDNRFGLFTHYNERVKAGATEDEVFDLEELMDATDVQRDELNLAFECNREFASRYGVTLEDALKNYSK